MNAKKLIELYGRRLTLSVRIFGFIVLLISGMLIALNGKRSDQAIEGNMNIESPMEE